MTAVIRRVMILRSSNSRPIRSRTSFLLRRGRSRLSLWLVLLPCWLPAAEPVPVRAVPVSSGPVTEALQLTGTFTAERSALLSPQVNGLIRTLRVDAGDQVEAGAMLLELDPVLASLDLDRAGAALGEARARLTEAQRLQAEASRLVSDNMIPQTTVDATAADVALNLATVARLEAERARQAEVVARHQLRAPFAGVVSRRLTELGEWAVAGQPVLELVATDPLRLDLQVPQDYFSDVVAGKPVIIRVDALAGVEIAGRVQARVPVADAASRTFLVRVVTAAADPRLSPGMSAQALIEIPRAGDALSVPRDALLRMPDGETRVWIIETAPDGALRAAVRRVQVGRSMGSQVEIRAGLSPDARVVIRGNELLREGEPVRLLEPARAGQD